MEHGLTAGSGAFGAALVAALDSRRASIVGGGGAVVA